MFLGQLEMLDERKHVPRLLKTGTVAYTRWSIWSGLPLLRNQQVAGSIPVGGSSLKSIT